MARRAGHGAGTITKRKDGRWQTAVSLEGGRRKFYYAKTYKEAQSRLRRALLDLEKGTLLVSRRQTVDEYLDGWLGNVKYSVGSPRTFESYRTCVSRIKPRIGYIRLDALKPAHVQQLYTNLLDTGLAPRTVEQTHSVLHRALAQAMKLDLCTRNVTEATDVPRPKHSEMRTLTAEELVRLFETSAEAEAQLHTEEVKPPTNWHSLWVLLGMTGLRKGEALGLKWSDIDFEQSRLVVRRSLQRISGAGLQFTDPKSAASRRTVQFGAKVGTALREHRQDQLKWRLRLGPQWKDEDLVFCTTFGGKVDPTKVNKQLDQALARAGLPRVRVHDLRHGCATMLLQAGVHPRIVQELLGHSDVAITLGTYSHVMPTMHREAAAKLDALLTEKSKAG